MVPLPAWIVRVFSPERWSAVQAARLATGANPGGWIQLSVAPYATIERLLYVVPAIATFVATREMGRWWHGRRLWIILAPVILIAAAEAGLGISQFLTRDPADVNKPISGTYVNRNHYAGFLEMAIPLALMWGGAIWKKPRQSAPDQRHQGVPFFTAVQSGVLLATGALIFLGVTISLSRMGFLASLAGITVVALGWMMGRHRGSRHRSTKWWWLVPALVPILLTLLVATNGLILRFGDVPSTGEISSDGRLLIWKDTAHLAWAYKWTGCGLGALEHGLYPFRTSLAEYTIDFAHNDYLQILAELGPIGALLLAGLAIFIFRRLLFVVLSPMSKHWAVALGLLGSLLAIALHSFADFNLYIPANGLTLAWIAGVAACPALLDDPEPSNGDRPRSIRARDSHRLLHLPTQQTPLAEI